MVRHDIFISYANENQPLAIQVCDFLRKHDLNCWIDLDGIPVGSKFDIEIEKAIRSCVIFLWIATNTSIGKDFVRSEVITAINRRKLVVPVFLDKIKVKDLPAPLDIKLINVQGLEFFDGLTPSNLEKLARTLREQLRAHRFRLLLLAAAAALVVGLAAYTAWHELRLSSRTPEAILSASGITSLPAGEVLKLAYSGQPPNFAANAMQLQLRLEILGRRKGSSTFSPLSDGESIASEVDDYLIVTQAISPGYLYVFQVDTAGNKTWLFPKNGVSSFSSGENPLKRDQLVQIPPADQSRALYLDDNTGLEHIYAVFTTVPWNDLENALEQNASTSTFAQSRPQTIKSPIGLTTRGVGGIRPVTLAPPAEVPISLNGQSFTVPLAAQPLTATGPVLAIERWFHHVAGE